jgi:hypothetical protein
MSKVGWYDPFLYFTFLYFTKINIYIYIDHHLTLFLYVRVNRYIYIEGVHFRYMYRTCMYTAWWLRWCWSMVVNVWYAWLRDIPRVCVSKACSLRVLKRGLLENPPWIVWGFSSGPPRLMTLEGTDVIYGPLVAEKARCWSGSAPMILARPIRATWQRPRYRTQLVCVYHFVGTLSVLICV